MKFTTFFDMQEALDEKINKSQGITGHRVMEERLLGLTTEVSEFANETKCFKFWSKKKPSEKDVILGEYVDIMHWLLSIGNYSGFTFRYELELEHINDRIEGSMTELINGMIGRIVEFRLSPIPNNYLKMWDYFLSIANKLNFSVNDIQIHYMKKNTINHNRQKQGY